MIILGINITFFLVPILRPPIAAGAMAAVGGTPAEASLRPTPRAPRAGPRAGLGAMRALHQAQRVLAVIVSGGKVMPCGIVAGM